MVFPAIKRHSFNILSDDPELQEYVKMWIKEERASRAAWARALANYLSTKPMWAIGGVKIIKELLLEAEKDDK